MVERAWTLDQKALNWNPNIVHATLIKIKISAGNNKLSYKNEPWQICSIPYFYDVLIDLKQEFYFVFVG